VFRIGVEPLKPRFWSDFTGLGDESSEGGKMTNKEGESSKKLSAAIERLTKLGLRVTDTTGKWRSIGFVGGVRRPEAKPVDDDNHTGSPKPSVN
jgi:hypothetical protein